MSRRSTGAFILGGLCGTIAGVAIGLLIAPRSGVESRAMAADAMNDAWDSAVDSYERTTSAAGEKFSNFGPAVDAKTDELRAKVDLARERMDQMRDSLSDAVAAASTQVSDAVSSVADYAAAVTEDAAAAVADMGETAAQSVRVEVVEETAGAEAAEA